MGMLVAAAPVMLGLGLGLSAMIAVPAWALDDTPTQTPYLSSKGDDARASVAAARPPASRRIEMDESRRPARVAPPPPAIASTPAAATLPAPLAPALPAATRAATLAGRAIGLP